MYNRIVITSAAYNFQTHALNFYKNGKCACTQKPNILASTNTKLSKPSNYTHLLFIRKLRVAATHGYLTYIYTIHICRVYIQNEVELFIIEFFKVSINAGSFRLFNIFMTNFIDNKICILRSYVINLITCKVCKLLTYNNDI